MLILDSSIPVNKNKHEEGRMMRVRMIIGKAKMRPYW
jgi:hypothetical protein